MTRSAALAAFFACTFGCTGAGATTEYAQVEITVDTILFKRFLGTLTHEDFRERIKQLSLNDHAWQSVSAQEKNSISDIHGDASGNAWMKNSRFNFEIHYQAKVEADGVHWKCEVVEHGFTSWFSHAHQCDNWSAVIPTSNGTASSPMT
jgi:limonene-1,2-epoxide hydrolase